MRKTSDIFGIFFPDRRAVFCMSLAAIIILQTGFIHGEEFFNFAEYRLKSNVRHADNDEKNEVSGKSGLRLSFNSADFRGYGSFSENSKIWEEAELGAGFFLFKKTLPLTIKIGHNSYSKSISKMKNPSPSSVINPLSKSFSFSPGTGASLPSMSSGRQPLSCSLNLKSGKENFPLKFEAETFVTEDRNSAVFFTVRYNLGRSIFMQQAFSAGRFKIEGKSTVLKKNNADFEADYFYSGLGEFCFHSPLLKLNCYSGIQESPYEANPVWFRIDGRTTFRFFMLNFSYFAIPTTKDSPKAAPLIGASASICRLVEQADLNPQILFLFDDKNASSLRIGFSAFESWKVTATNTPVQLNTAKMRAAASYENRFLEFRFDWTHANILLSGEAPVKSARPEEYITLGFSSSLAGKKAKFSLSGNYTNYPPAYEKVPMKEVYSADIKIALTQASLTGNGGVSLTLKDGERCGGKFTAGAGFSFRKRFLRAVFSAELQVPF